MLNWELKDLGSLAFQTMTGTEIVIDILLKENFFKEDVKQLQVIRDRLDETRKNLVRAAAENSETPSFKRSYNQRLTDLKDIGGDLSKLIDGLLERIQRVQPEHFQGLHKNIERIHHLLQSVRNMQSQ